jgi:hypothetical protein
MTGLLLSSYIPWGDLARIIVTVMIVAVIAPAAAAVAIAGIDRRNAGDEGVGSGLIALGAGLLALLVSVGIFALVNR